MSFILTIIKTVGGPGSAGFFLAAVAGAVLVGWCWPRLRWRLRLAVAGLAMSYLALAIPAVANGIINALPPTVANPSAEAIDRIQVLVVFDGDNPEGRLRRVRRVLRQTRPGEVHLLGNDLLLARLRTLLSPTTMLHYDASTWNTSAQVQRVRQMAALWPPMTTAVVASRVQMPRVAALLDETRAIVLLVPSPLDHEPAASGVAMLVPALAALRASRDAIYEHVALRYYRWRGDIR